MIEIDRDVLWRAPALPVMNARELDIFVRQVIAYLASADKSRHGSDPPEKSQRLRAVAHGIVLSSHHLVCAPWTTKKKQTVRNYVLRAMERATPRLSFSGVALAHGAIASDGRDQIKLRLSGNAQQSLIDWLNSEARKPAFVTYCRHFSAERKGDIVTWWSELVADDPRQQFRRKLTPAESAIFDHMSHPISRETIEHRLDSEFTPQEICAAFDALKAEHVICAVQARNLICPEFSRDWFADVTSQLGSADRSVAREVLQLLEQAERVKSPDDPTLLDIVAQADAILPDEGSNAAQARGHVGFNCDMQRGASIAAPTPEVRRAIGHCLEVLTSHFVLPNPVHTSLHATLLERFGEGMFTFRRCVDEGLRSGPQAIERSVFMRQADQKIAQLFAASDDPSKPIDLAPLYKDHAPQPHLTEGAALFLPAEIAEPHSDGAPYAELVGLRLGGRMDYVARLGGQSQALDAYLETLKADDTALDTLAVEVLYCPSVEAHEIVIRPRAHQHFLHLNGTGSRHLPGAINIDDILVLVTENGMSAFHKPTGKFVRFVLNTSHDWMHALHPQFYRLLGALANPWSFQAPRLPETEQVGHQPELRVGGVIVSPSYWSPTPSRYRVFKDLTTAKRRTFLDTFLDTENIPQHVFVGVGDKRVPLDMSLSADRDRCVTELGRKGCIIQKRYPELGTVRDAVTQETFQNCELITSFKSNIRAAPTLKPTQLAEFPVDAAQEPIVGPVLFFKLYGQRERLSEVLVDVLSPVLDQLQNRGLITHWFFMRFADPDVHIRLRVFVSTKTEPLEVMALLSSVLEMLVKQRHMARWMLDSYRREWARYGGRSAMQHAETLFAVDTDTSLQWIRLLLSKGQYSPEQARVCGIWMLLAWMHLLGLGAVHSKTLAGEMVETLKQAAPGRQDNVTKADFLKFKASVQKSNFVEIVRAHCVASSNPAARLRTLDQEGRLTVPPRELVLSLAHMSFNRLLPDWSRLEERRIYMVARKCLYAFPDLWDHVNVLPTGLTDQPNTHPSIAGLMS